MKPRPPAKALSQMAHNGSHIRAKGNMAYVVNHVPSVPDVRQEKETVDNVQETKRFAKDVLVSAP